MAIFNKDGSVDLYHNNVKKFETTADGIQVTGKIFPSSHIDMADNVKLLIGTGDDICLLYTSPSPRDQRGSRMPSSA